MGARSYREFLQYATGVRTSLQSARRTLARSSGT
nr:MAG TPA: hypothetical protein [Caudoviricetes sp.]